MPLLHLLSSCLCHLVRTWFDTICYCFYSGITRLKDMEHEDCSFILKFFFKRNVMRRVVYVFYIKYYFRVNSAHGWHFHSLHSEKQVCHREINFFHLACMYGLWMQSSQSVNVVTCKCYNFLSVTYHSLCGAHLLSDNSVMSSAIEKKYWHCHRKEILALPSFTMCRKLRYLVK